MSIGSWSLRAVLTIVVLLAGVFPINAQAPDPTEDVLDLIQRNNVALPAAYQAWDLSALGEYLTGQELDERAADLQRVIVEGAEVWFEIRDFVVLSVAFPQADRAVVDSMETWYEWASLRGVAVERTWTAPQRYEVRAVGGRWYIEKADILAELPAFQPVAAPAAAPAPPPPPVVQPPAPPAAAPAAPAPTAAPRTCCRVCTTGRACGNSCIAASLNCRVGVGCACNATGPGTFREIWEAVLAVLPDEVVIAMAEEGDCIAQFGAGVPRVPLGMRILVAD